MSSITIPKLKPHTPSAIRSARRPNDLVWPLSVAQYHAMIDAGILTDEDPVELLEGWLIYKMPKNPRHSIALRYTRRSLERLLGDVWYVEPQDAITLETSEPEPDVIVARGNEVQFVQRHPGPQDLVLVVEVADSSLQRDRTRKKRVYAKAGIPVYWIVNLVENTLEVYQEPLPKAKEPGYRQRQVYSLNETVPVIIDGVVVGQLAVREVIPEET